MRLVGAEHRRRQRGGSALAFDLSYNGLSVEAQHAFIALAHADFGDFSVQDADAVAAAELDQLADANLIRNTAPDRFHFPALLRRYALTFSQ
ncbi:hypothetical protein NLX83_21160 [Allokutzneria sp. A3M-2-11 16]|uniref:hypothetical protein n=1 Tax=Allokutzneria sp. A3M-2-11 16 TaxID=2962043 RepID=UPI0020B8E3E6|nr:hypothetical protein [Allokutzneria sp. A3M-2-11 16]MCP3801777.1 hypothetical protein [Allokutzneria sp. A3M-2-11 16]